MLMFEDMLTVYSGHAASFSDLSLQKCFFQSFTNLSKRVLSVAMITTGCGGRSTEAAKNDSYIQADVLSWSNI